MGKSLPECRNHSEHSRLWRFTRTVRTRIRRRLPIHSWVDQPHVWDFSSCITFHFRGYRRTQGHIVTITSLGPQLRVPCRRDGCITKHAVNRLVESPSVETLSLSFVTLHLWDVPRSGYIPLEAMATALSSLTRLETFWLSFKSPRSCPGRVRRHPPPPTRSVLPALTHFIFRGITEYLEDLVARIDAPLLDWLEITFFRQLIFHTPRFAQFIGRTPNFVAHDEAHVVFTNYKAELKLARYRGLKLEIYCSQSDWLLSMLTQVCSSSLPLISSLEYLYIHEYGVGLIRPCWGR